MTMSTCFKNMKTLRLSQVPLPNAPLLQGGRGFSHSSSKKILIGCLASERKRKIMKEAERKQKLLEQDSPKTSIIE